MMTDQQAYWDRAASEKQFTIPFQMDRFELQVHKDAAILDVGCGYGRILNALYAQGFKNICGIDFSQKMVEKGSLLYPFLDIKHYSSVFPFEDNTFDAVVVIAVLTCIVKDFDQEQLLGEIERVLKPQGILVVNDFLINHDQRNIDRYNACKEKNETYGVFELEEGVRLRHHTIDHLFQLTRNFQRTDFQTLEYTTMNKNTSNGFYYLGKLKRPDIL